MEFRLETARRPGAVVVTPVGDLDVYAARPLRDALNALAAEDTTDRVIIDLVGSDFIDSSGLGVIVGALKQLENRGRRLALVSSKPHLLKILQITRLSDVIPVGNSIDEVLRS